MTVELSPRATELAEHARQLLAAGGYNGFSYADLSEKVGIGKASIHHHFPILGVDDPEENPRDFEGHS